jgi:hypothetical protein
VVDRIRGIRDVEQTDFEMSLPLKKINDSLAPYVLEGHFHDSLSKSNEIGLSVKQRLYTWPNQNFRDKFFVLEYTIINTSGYTIPEFYAGLVADWDIEDYEKNRADYNPQKNLIYTYSTENKGPYCGVQLLSQMHAQRAYSIDHIVGGGGGVDLTDNDVFSKTEKYTTLSTSRPKAGIQPNGNDVMQVLGTGPLWLEDSLVFSAAILVADSKQELEEIADTIHAIYNPKNPISIQEFSAHSLKVYPNPATQKLVVEFSSRQFGELKLISAQGREVLVMKVTGQESTSVDVSYLKPGIYFLRFKDNYQIVVVN